MTGRRTLKFRSLDDLQQDVNHLLAVPCQTLGNWSLGMIFDHLYRALEVGYVDVGFRAPWVLRKLIIPWVKNSLLTKPMSPGWKLPSRAAKLLPQDGDVQELGTRYLQLLDRLRQEPPECPHPVLGYLAHQEWVSFTLRHAEMHLSFVIPAPVAVAEVG